jgi:hypothetical protein
MQRRERLFALASQLEQKNIKLILIQIDEAHSTKWPIGRDYQPEPHANLQDRIQRTIQFNETYKPPYPILIDNWNNDFANMYRCWPDQYILLDHNFVICAKSQYDDAKIKQDCVDLLKQL